MGPEGPIDWGWATATGPRPDNQDRGAASSRWAIVADGAGGHAGGALAAKLAVRAAVATLTAAVGPSGEAARRPAPGPDPGPDPASGLGDDAPGGGTDAGAADRAVVDAAVRRANADVRAWRDDDPAVATMVSTITLAVATAVAPGGSEWLVANVGDSPAWLVGPDDIVRVSTEHNMAAELARWGAITADAARTHPGRHAITRAIGAEPGVEAAVVAVRLRAGDMLVLASDGIEVADEADVQRLAREAASAQSAAERLVELALACDATDNVTAAVVRHRP